MTGFPRRRDKNRRASAAVRLNRYRACAVRDNAPLRERQRPRRPRSRARHPRQRGLRPSAAPHISNTFTACGETHPKKCAGFSMQRFVRRERSGRGKAPSAPRKTLARRTERGLPQRPSKGPNQRSDERGPASTAVGREKANSLPTAVGSTENPAPLRANGDTRQPERIPSAQTRKKYLLDTGEYPLCLVPASSPDLRFRAVGNTECPRSGRRRDRT